MWEALKGERGYSGIGVIRSHFLMIFSMSAADSQLREQVTCANSWMRTLLMPQDEAVHWHKLSASRHALLPQEPPCIQLVMQKLCKPHTLQSIALTKLLNMFVVFPGHVSRAYRKNSTKSQVSYINSSLSFYIDYIYLWKCDVHLHVKLSIYLFIFHTSKSSEEWWDKYISLCINLWTDTVSGVLPAVLSGLVRNNSFAFSR